MPLIPPETIEQILSANDIVEVVSAYIPLKRAGAVYKALCPFHQEKTPSFNVNPQRQLFKCFGCGAGGSAIRFVMTYENLSFVEAAKKLAERAGIRLVDAEMSPEDAARYTLRRRLLALHAEAADFFHFQLMRKPGGQAARDYLKSRGITGEVAKSWKLGYAPDSFDAFREFAFAQGFSQEEILQSGLVKERDSDQDGGGRPARGGRVEFYDRFRGRVMFPICNDTGEVIGFSGRVLDADAKTAKYINSPETILFTKGSVLFGLHRSKRALIEKASAIVCEGQLDLITAFEAGITNVIAPQGTAFTERQAHILKRYVEEVVLCFDADAAGQKAADRSLASLLAENLVVRVAEIPQGEDPDSLIRGRGADAFRQIVDGAKDYFDYQIDRLARQPEFSTPRGKLEASQKIAGAISLLTNPILRETVLHKATQRLEISAQEFAKLLKLPKRENPARAGKPEDRVEPLDPEVELDTTMRFLASAVLQNEDARAWVLEEPWNEVLEREPGSGLLVKILQADIQPGDAGSINAFMATLETGEEAVVSGLLNEGSPELALKVVQDCWNELERRQIRRRIQALQARVKRPGITPEDILVLQKQILDLHSRLSHIARPFSQPPAAL